MNSIQLLTSWLEEMQAGKDPIVPYSLHPLVRTLHGELGLTDSIDLLQKLDEYAKANPGTPAGHIPRNPRD